MALTESLNLMLPDKHSLSLRHLHSLLLIVVYSGAWAANPTGDAINKSSSNASAITIPKTSGKPTANPSSKTSGKPTV